MPKCKKTHFHSQTVRASPSRITALRYDTAGYPNSIA